MLRDNTHVYYHFTTLARSYLCEDLQNKGLGDIPGQIPHIPTNKERDEKNWVFVKQEVACKQRLVNRLATTHNNALNLLKKNNESELNVVQDSINFD